MKKIIIAFALLFFANARAQTTDVTFLRELKDSIKFYFSGEFHSNTNYESRYELLMTLYANNNVRVLILEAPKEFEFNLNRYITTADTDAYYVRQYHNYLRPVGRYQFDDYLKKIKAFNESLKDPTQKISILCPDMNLFLSNALFKLDLIYSDGTTSDKDILKYLKKAGRIGLFSNPRKNTNKKIKVALELKYLLDTREQEWKDLYLQNFTQVKNAINALYRNAVAYQKYGIMSLPVREEIIYENIMDYYKQNPNVSYYGNFGQLHTLLNCDPSRVVHNNYFFASSMANELNKTPELENKVCTMPYYYLTENKTVMIGNLEVESMDFLTPDEKEKYKQQFDADGKRIYVPITKLQKADELNYMFDYLIILR